MESHICCDIFTAASMSHFECVVKFVKGGEDINAKNEKELPLLTCAVWSSQLSIVKYLLDCGIDVNACDSSGKTALHEACCQQNDTIAYLLISYGANVTATEYRKWTPIHYAALVRNIILMDILVQKGASLLAKNNNEMTPLHVLMRVLGGNISDKILEDLEGLLRHEFDITQRNYQGQTILHIAKEFKILKLLLSYCDCPYSLKDDKGRTPFDCISNKAEKYELEEMFQDGEFQIPTLKGCY